MRFFSPTAVRSVSAAAVAAIAVAAVAAAPATQAVDPITHETPEATAANVALTKDLTELGNAMTPDAMGDPQRRAELAKTLLPLIDRAMVGADTLARLDPNMQKTMVSQKRYLVVSRAVLGDAEAAATIQKDAGSTDAAVALSGKIDQLRVQWTQAGRDVGGQATVAQAALELAKTNPSANEVTGLLLSLSGRAAKSDTGDDLRKTALAMDSNLAKHIKLSEEGDSKLKSHVGHPLVLAGTMPDGKTFSSDSFKGKVVLVDFWATWCGPCKAELPHIRDAYTKFHEQGLEVLGVSSDYSADKLTHFAAQNNLPWPQLFDANAAEDQKWHPLTEQLGIAGIPVLVLIDKKGVCRSVNGRQDLEKQILELLKEPA